MSCLMAYLLLIGGPAICLFYAICVWITYALAFEITWSSKSMSLGLRVGLLIAAIACSIGLCESEHDQTIAAILPLAMVFFGTAGYFVYQTRVTDVVGMTTVPYWGANHLQGKVIAITGANQGIGKETTLQLAQMGATVLMLCRSEARAKQAIQDIRDRATVPLEEEQLIFVPMDLGDFASVRKAVQTISDYFLMRKTTNNNSTKIDVLINNAGLMMGNKTRSTDGYELMMQANHLGHFLLTRLLLDQELLVSSSSSSSTTTTTNNQKVAVRILNLTSSTYQLQTNGFDFDDLFCDHKRSYTLFGQYSMTKLANVLNSKEQSRRWPPQDGVMALAVHPGIVRTNVTSNMNWYWRYPDAMFAWFVASMQKTPAEGAYNSVYCAAAPLEELPPSGSYMMNGQAHSVHKSAESIDDAKRLWEVSERLVGLVVQEK